MRIRNILKWRRKNFFNSLFKKRNNITFNGSTTFAQSNDVVSKTAYNGTVSGNVTIGMDWEDSFIDINWNRNHSLGTWTLAEVLIWTNPSLSQTWSFTIIVDFKPVNNPPNNNWGVFWSSFDCCLRRSNTWTWRRTLRGSTEVSTVFSWIINWNRYQAIFVYNHTENKYYMYLGWTLLNPWGTTWPTTFLCNDWGIWDRFVWNGNASSSENRIYSARIYTSALTDTQRTTELALGQKQTARKDCVLEILPDYFALPAAPTVVYDSVGNNNGTITGGVTFPWLWMLFNWTTWRVWATAISAISIATPFSFCARIRTWSNITSNQILFHNTISWTNITVLMITTSEIRAGLFNGTYFTRKSIACLANTDYIIHWVYNWSTIDLYVNTVSASWNNALIAWTAAWLSIGNRRSNNDLFFWGTIYSLEFYNIALTLPQITSDQNLYNPSITTGLINRYIANPSTIYDVKAFTPATPVVISTSFQLGADAPWINTTEFVLVNTPYWYVHIRTSSNTIRWRYDSGWSRESIYTLWNWDRVRHNIVCSMRCLNWNFVLALFVDWVKRDTDTFAVIPATLYWNYINLWKFVLGTPIPFNWKISNTKIFIWTITDAEWVAMSNWNPIVPANATLLAYPRRLPPYDNTMTDVSGNWYDFTLTP